MSSILGSLLKSDSEEEPPIPIRNPTRITRRATAAWRRTALRLLFLLSQATHQKVVDHWTGTAAGTTEPPPRRSSSSSKKTNPDRPRRDDLTGVGRPIPPTGKVYPIARDQCPHHSAHGETLLRAWGGRKSGQPWHLWVCQGCGSRWERIESNDSRSHAPGNPRGALRPTPESDGPFPDAKEESEDEHMVLGELDADVL